MQNLRYLLYLSQCRSGTERSKASLGLPELGLHTQKLSYSWYTVSLPYLVEMMNEWHTSTVFFDRFFHRSLRIHSENIKGYAVIAYHDTFVDGNNTDLTILKPQTACPRVDQRMIVPFESHLYRVLLCRWRHWWSQCIYLLTTFLLNVKGNYIINTQKG